MKESFFILYLPIIKVFRYIGSEKPNVIVTIVDDSGWADIGHNNPRVYTPNLDKLADSGSRYINQNIVTLYESKSIKIK